VSSQAITVCSAYSVLQFAEKSCVHCTPVGRDVLRTLYYSPQRCPAYTILQFTDVLRTPSYSSQRCPAYTVLQFADVLCTPSYSSHRCPAYTVLQFAQMSCVTVLQFAEMSCVHCTTVGTDVLRTPSYSSHRCPEYTSTVRTDVLHTLYYSSQRCLAYTVLQFAQMSCVHCTTVRRDVLRTLSYSSHRCSKKTNGPYPPPNLERNVGPSCLNTNSPLIRKISWAVIPSHADDYKPQNLSIAAYSAGRIPFQRGF
jgi:hypothetical protein